MNERKPRIVFVNNKENPTFDKVQVKLDAFHSLRQQIDDDLTLMRDSIELDIKFNGPVRIIPISDTHLFAVQTDTTKVNELLKKLDDPNTYGVIMGDFIEGANPKIVDHINNVEIGFTDQIRSARKMIEPFIETGKILCMVGTFTGHEGWGDSNLGIDVVQLIAMGFKQPDGTDLKVLFNGGKLNINMRNGEKYSQLVYHAPGGGGSDEINPLGAQRNRLWEYINHRGSVGGVGGGDWHHRAGVSKELTVDLKTGKEKSHVLYSNGTTKGNDPNRPDTFLTKMAKGPTLAPGVQIILNQFKREKGDGRNGEYVWASYGYNKGEVLYEAAKLWDSAEKKHKTKSHIEEIIQREVKPKAEFDRRNSRTKVKDNRFDTPMFENFKWKFEPTGDLPILISKLGNTRYSSTSFEKRDKEEYLKMLKEIEKNPFHYGLVGRHIVDPDVAKQYDRDEILDRVIKDHRGIASQGRLLGFMMSSSLLNERWKKEVLGDWYEEVYIDGWGNERSHWVRERKGALYPGDYIYTGLDRKVPLYLNQSLMNLDFGNGINYEYMSLDHLSHSGSEFDMFRGLVQAKRKNLASSDVVVGGHMPGAGFMETPDGIYIAPGWFSEYDSRGKANTKRTPMGGQGTIVLPKQRMVFPASTFLESIDTLAALMLLKGLRENEKKSLL